MALVQTLQDNFDDNSFNATLWSRSSATEVLEQNQRMELRSSTAAKWLRSQTTYDLTGSHLQFKWISHTGTLPPTVGLQIQNANPSIGAQNQLAFDFTGTNFRWKYSVGTTFTYGTSTAIGSYQYFRIREASGTTYWDASPDGLTWTNIHSVANPITVTSMYVFAYSQWIFAASTNALFIDELNIPAPQSITMPLLTNSETMYAPIVAPDQNLSLPLISNSNSLYAMTLTPGAVTISPPLISSAEVLYPPQVLNNTLYIPYLDSVEQLFAPTITTGPVDLLLPFITDTNVLYEPIVAPDQDLLLSFISSPAQLFAPSISTGAVTIEPPLYVEVNQLFPPTLIPGPAMLTLPFLASVSDLFAPEIRRAGLLDMPFLVNTSDFYRFTLYFLIDPFVVPGGNVEQITPRVAIIVDDPRLKQPTDRFTDEEIPESALTDDLVVIADDPDALTGGPVDYSQTPVGFASLPLPLVKVSVDQNHGGNIEDATGAGSIEQIRERGAVLSENPRIQSAGFVNIPAGSIVNADGKITESNDPPPRGKLG